MPPTIEKENELYRVKYKNLSSIKWATIAKLARAAIKPEIKEEVGRLLEKYKKMEVVVGTIPKDQKFVLMLRVLDGSKQVYEKVLDKDFKPLNNTDEEEYGQQQQENIQKANLIVDEYFRQTQTFEKFMEECVEDLEEMRSLYQQQVQKFGSAELNENSRKLIESDRDERLNAADDLQNRLTVVFKEHYNVILKFRGGGALRFARVNGVDEDGAEKLAVRFTEHTKYFALVEQKVQRFGLKIQRLKSEISLAYKGFSNNPDPVKATVEYLDSMIQSWKEQIQFQIINTIQKSNLNGVLKRTTDISSVDSSIGMIESKLQGAKETFQKLEKRMTATQKQIPPKFLKEKALGQKLLEIAELKQQYTEAVKNFEYECGNTIADLVERKNILQKENAPEPTKKEKK